MMVTSATPHFKGREQARFSTWERFYRECAKRYRGFFAINFLTQGAWRSQTAGVPLGGRNSIGITFLKKGVDNVFVLTGYRRFPQKFYRRTIFVEKCPDVFYRMIFLLALKCANAPRKFQTRVFAS